MSTPDLAWRRAGDSDRPLARDRASFDERHRARLALYSDVADAVVPAGRTREPRAGARRRRAAARGARRDAPAVGDQQFRRVPGVVRARRARRGAVAGRALRRRDASASPTSTWRRSGWRRSASCEAAIVISAGEQAKTLASAELVWRDLARGGMTRSDQLIALGGGVVGDLAGFCAATYQRGVAVVQVPTTLVAQVDSAYGGKTGIDLPEAKNYVGAYHQPAAVLVDPATLASLPAAEAAAGYAEVIKTAIIAGGELWKRIEADLPIDDDVIFDCARCKLQIVAADERDEGPPAGAEPRPHGRTRDRDGDRVPPLPPRRGCRARPAGGAVAVAPAAAARARRRAARRARPADAGRGGRPGGRRARPASATRSARAIACRSCSSMRPGPSSPAREVTREALDAALAELCA